MEEQKTYLKKKHKTSKIKKNFIHFINYIKCMVSILQLQSKDEQIVGKKGL